MGGEDGILDVQRSVDGGRSWTTLRCIVIDLDDARRQRDKNTVEAAKWRDARGVITEVKYRIVRTRIEVVE